MSGNRKGRGKGDKPPWLQDADTVGQSSDNWVIPTRDAQGHHTRMWINMPPLMKDLLNKIVGEKAFPYRSAPAVVRHAIIRHAKWLAAQCDNPDLKSVVVQVDAVLDIMRDEDFQADFLLTFDKLQERVTAFTANGDYDQATFFLLRVRNALKKMPSGYWSSRYVTEFDRKFQHILERVKKESQSADLENFSEEG